MKDLGTAMILAAGQGRRLQPLTHEVAKPLVPIGDEPLLTRTAKWLSSAGFRHLVINAHHLAEQVEAEAGEIARRFGVDVDLSIEPELLGTGGGIRHAVDLWRGDGAWIINGDVVADVGPEIWHEAPRSARRAMMIVRESPDARKLGPVYLEDGKITGILSYGRTDAPPTMFTGIHYLGRELAAGLPEPGCVIRDGYRYWIEQGQVFGHLHEGYWAEVGTPERYDRVQRDWSQGRLSWLA